MANTFGNEHFIARFCNNLFLADCQPQLPLHDGHELVRGMDEIIPLSAWRIGEHITRIASTVPVLNDLVTIERQREFMENEMGHGQSDVFDTCKPFSMLL